MPLRGRKFKEISHEDSPSRLLDSNPAFLPETTCLERRSIGKGRRKEMYSIDTSWIGVPSVNDSSETEMAGSYLCRSKHYKQLER
jgi:hypothetical protein